MAQILVACPRDRWFWATEILHARPAHTRPEWARVVLSKLARMGVVESKNVTDADGPRPEGCYRRYRVVVPVEVSIFGRVSVLLPDADRPETGGGGA